MVGFALVVGRELAFGHGDEFVLDHLLAEGGEAINEHLAVEVVVFVLEHACFETFEPSLLFLTILVEVVDEHLGRTFHALVDARNGEASFGHGD